MKYFSYITLIALTLLVMFPHAVYTQGNISGTVKYKNILQSPIKDSAIVRLYQADTLYSISEVAPDGSYSFSSLPDGTYKLAARVTKFSGGWNAMDAYLILRNYVGFQPQLTGLNFRAGDVNGDGLPATIDPLAIQIRYIGNTNTWGNIVNNSRYGDWVSEYPTVTISNGNNVNLDIQVLCVGDVDGSFIPD